jgi:hypothetical protein
MRALTTAVVALIAGGVIAACSTTTGGTGTHSPVPTPPTPTSSSRGIAPPPSASALPTAPPSSVSPPSSSVPSLVPSSAPASGVPADVSRVLLSAAEIGHGFVATGTESTSNDPYPCTPNAPPVDEAVPPSETGTADFAKASSQLVITEQVAVYADLSHAVSAQQLTDAGLACAHGTLAQGQRIDITGPTDISAALTAHVDNAEAWDIRAGATVGALVQVRIHAVMVHFAFVAANKKHPGNIDVKQILETGIAKVINGG